MKIAVTSQNFRTITGHAGKTRRFIIYGAQGTDAPVEIEYPIVDTEEFMERAKGLIKHRTVKYAYEYKKERKRRKSKSYELEYFRCPYCASTFIEYIDGQAYCAMCGKVIPEELLW